MGAAADLLLSRFPLRPITSKALESQGGFETIGFKRRFCILFVAVDKKYAAGGKQETTAGKSGPLEARSLQEKITRWNEKEKLQRGNGFPRPACGLVSE